MIAGEVSLGVILVLLYIFFLSLIRPTTETKPLPWVAFLLFRIPYGALHIVDGLSIQYGERKAFAVAFASLDLLPLILLFSCIFTVGPPAITPGAWRPLIPWFLSSSVPLLAIFVVGSTLESSSQPAVQHAGHICWTIATAILAGLTTLACAACFMAPMLAGLFSFVPEGFGSREVERQAYIAVPVTLRTGWALASVLRGEVYVPQWHGSAESSVFLRHLTLALLPELLATLVFVSATYRTRWSIEHATRRSLRIGRTSRFSVLATGVGETSSTCRQRVLSTLERDVLAGVSSNMMFSPSTNNSSNNIALGYGNHNHNHNSNNYDEEEAVLGEEEVSLLAGRRKLALVMVLSCLEGLEYPISPMERIAIRRRVDFFGLASPATFDAELARMGWTGVEELHRHRAGVIDMLRRLLSTMPTDARPSLYRRKNGVPLAVSLDLAAIDVDTPKDTDSRGEFGTPRISRISGIRIQRLSGLSSLTHI